MFFFEICKCAITFDIGTLLLHLRKNEICFETGNFKYGIEKTVTPKFSAIWYRKDGYSFKLRKMRSNFFELDNHVVRRIFCDFVTKQSWKLATEIFLMQTDSRIQINALYRRTADAATIPQN